MSDEKPKAGPKGPKVTGDIKEISIRSRGQVKVKHQPTLPHAPPQKQIHGRRPLPPVKEAPHPDEQDATDESDRNDSE
jgi:hypothetical protein